MLAKVYSCHSVEVLIAKELPKPLLDKAYHSLEYRSWGDFLSILCILPYQWWGDKFKSVLTGYYFNLTLITTYLNRLFPPFQVSTCPETFTFTSDANADCKIQGSKL